MKSNHLATVVVALVLGVCVHAGLTDVPPNLSPRTNEPLAMMERTKGTQHPKCRARAGVAGGHAWLVAAPDAVPYGRRGNQTGMHGAGSRRESRATSAG